MFSQDYINIKIKKIFLDVINPFFFAELKSINGSYPLIYLSFKLLNIFNDREFLKSATFFL